MLPFARVSIIGLGLIEDVVRDRQRYRGEATRSVAQSLAGPQTLLGPFVHSACVESWDVETGKGDERRTTEQRREFMLTAMPDQLQVRSSVGMEERARGLHKVNTFNLKAEHGQLFDDLIKRGVCFKRLLQPGAGACQPPGDRRADQHGEDLVLDHHRQRGRRQVEQRGAAESAGADHYHEGTGNQKS